MAQPNVESPRPETSHWILRVVLVGLAYFAVGIVFAALAGAAIAVLVGGAPVDGLGAIVVVVIAPGTAVVGEADGVPTEPFSEVGNGRAIAVLDGMLVDVVDPDGVCPLGDG